MIDKGVLEQLFREPESERVERKRNANDLADIRENISAFANDLANRREQGVIFVGVENNGACAQLDVSDRLLSTLAGLRNDGKLTPFPLISVEKRTIDACTVACILVTPTDNPPIRLDNRIFVRVGPTTRLATAQEEQVLVEKRRWGNLPFDAQGVPGCALEDLDLFRFEREFLPALVSPESLAANRRTIQQQLLSLRLLKPDGTPSTTAVLLLAKNPQEFFPGAYVQALRVAGAELTTAVIDQREFSGPLTDQLRQLDEYLGLNVRRPLTVTSSTHTVTPDYPIEALRQLVRNAVIHRAYEGTNAPSRIAWYSDRVEISSPGGPFGQVTEKNFGMPGVTDYRNPTLAGTLKELGFVERFGLGLQIVRRALRENGNPPAEFTILPTHIHITVRARQ